MFKPAEQASRYLLAEWKKRTSPESIPPDELHVAVCLTTVAIGFTRTNIDKLITAGLSQKRGTEQ